MLTDVLLSGFPAFLNGSYLLQEHMY